jgi:hypothetical protein
MNRAHLKWMALMLLLGGCEDPMGSVPRSSAPHERQTLAVKQLASGQQVSTRLTLRWQRSGRLEVVDAVELPGFLKLETNLVGRQYVYEVLVGTDVLAVQALDIDFEQRAEGGDTQEPAHLAADTETFFMDVPGLGLDRMLYASVRLLEFTAPHGETSATVEAVGRLEARGLLVGVADVGATEVGEFIRTSGRRVTSRPVPQPDDLPPPQ